MTSFNDLFNSVKNTATHKKKLSVPNNKKANASSKSEEKIDINNTPTPSSVHTNIIAKQSTELSFLFDMAYVAATSDNSFYLPHPYKRHHSGKNAQKYLDKFNSDISFTDNYFNSTLELSQKLDMHSTSRLELFSEIRKIYPDFCHNIEEKMEPEDFDFYKQNKTNLKKCLSSPYPYSHEISSEDILFEYRDKLSKLIDTLDFSKACKIEDSFVLSELNIFLQKLSELCPEKQLEFSNKEISINDNESINALDFVIKLQNERIDRIKKYSTIENLYNKMQKQSYLRLNIRKTKDKETNRLSTKDLYTNDEIR